MMRVLKPALMAGTIAVGSLLLSALPSAAAVFNATTCAVGGNQCVLPDGSTATAVNGFLVTQTFRGATGIGVNQSGNSATSGPQDEIQISTNESINLAFASAQFVQQIVLLFLYNQDDFADPKEIANITAQTSTGQQIVSIQSLNNAGNVSGTNFTVSGAATVVRTNTAPAPGNTGNLGRFVLSGLFGGATVTSLNFAAGDAGCVNGDCSDYAIESVSYVPLPAAGVLLLAGLGGLGLMARRHKSMA